MIIDKTAACACCTAALATLKNLYPKRITIKDLSGNSRTEDITYEQKSGIIYCSCRDYFAYSKSSENSFSLYCDGISASSVADNNELIKMIFLSVSKVDVKGAAVYLNRYSGNVF